MSKTLLIRVCSDCSVGWAREGIAADRLHTAGTSPVHRDSERAKEPDPQDRVNENQMRVTQAPGLVLLSVHRDSHP